MQGKPFAPGRPQAMSQGPSDPGASAGAASDPMERPLPGRTEYPHIVDWENEWESLLEDPAFDEGAPAGSESDSDEAEPSPDRRSRDERIRALVHRMPHVPRPAEQVSAAPCGGVLPCVCNTASVDRSPLVPAPALLHLH